MYRIRLGFKGSLVALEDCCVESEVAYHTFVEILDVWSSSPNLRLEISSVLCQANFSREKGNIRTHQSMYFTHQTIYMTTIHNSPPPFNYTFPISTPIMSNIIIPTLYNPRPSLPSRKHYLHTIITRIPPPQIIQRKRKLTRDAHDAISS